MKKIHRVDFVISGFTKDFRKKFFKENSLKLRKVELRFWIGWHEIFSNIIFKKEAQTAELSNAPEIIRIRSVWRKMC